MNLPGFHQPLWTEMTDEFIPKAGTLPEQAEVVIVGAGITGLTAALLLQQAGFQTVVLEMNKVGGGTTGHSTGHLDAHSDEYLSQIAHSIGSEAARAIVQAETDAINLIEKWVQQFGINCDFKRIPAYLYTEQDDKLDLLQKEAYAAEKAGLGIDKTVAPSLPFDLVTGVQIPKQARFNPLAYVYGLAKALQNAGGLILEGISVQHYRRDDKQVRVETSSGKMRSNNVILAGHTTLAGPVFLQSRSYPYQSYVLAVRVKDALEDALYWDLQEPYHYIRIAASDDPHLLIIGGADHKTGEGNPHEAFAHLESYAKSHFPVDNIEGRWSHEFFLSADKLPFIGKVPEASYLLLGATFAGDGLPLGTASGIQLAQMVMGNETRDTEIFDPLRMNLFSSAPRFLNEFTSMASHFVGDRLKTGTVENPEDLAPGEGGLFTRGGERVGVYRDENSKLHFLSPVCRHLGCIVQWNAEERTWDCPCHGGRYKATGEAIAGPPHHGLEPRERT